MTFTWMHGILITLFVGYIVLWVYQNNAQAQQNANTKKNSSFWLSLTQMCIFALVVYLFVEYCIVNKKYSFLVFGVAAFTWIIMNYLTDWCGPNNVCLGVVSFLKIMSVPGEIILLIIGSALYFVGL